MQRESLLPRAELKQFWSAAPETRQAILLEAVAGAHAWHYQRNAAYRQVVSARGIGATVDLEGGASCSLLPRLLRPTAQTFKSYIDVLGTPFPQERPQAFLEWLAFHLSLDLPRDRLARFRPRYPSLEVLLRDVETIYSEFGFEISTSSGTSGRATILVRDREAVEGTVESFYLSFQRYLGIDAVERAVFIMPRETRIAMARMAAFSVKRLGLPEDRIHFAIPFPAEPDRVRIRSGRTFRPGWPGKVERHFWYPFMNWMQEHYVTPRAVKTTVELLDRAEASGEHLLLFGGWVQLHAVSRQLQAEGRTIRLAPGSLMGTGGGLKELYPFAPAQIREELAVTIRLTDGRPAPLRDVYGMAEGNWAAMQCAEGHYHVPPWVLARTLDEDDHLQEADDSTGLLAFYDPMGGGRLFPAFFKTADRVRLLLGREECCPCGEPGVTIARESIQRVDLLDEAGCAAQV
jgi:hypothetical protein